MDLSGTPCTSYMYVILIDIGFDSGSQKVHPSGEKAVSKGTPSYLGNYNSCFDKLFAIVLGAGRPSSWRRNGLNNYSRSSRSNIQDRPSCHKRGVGPTLAVAQVRRGRGKDEFDINGGIKLTTEVCLPLHAARLIDAAV